MEIDSPRTATISPAQIRAARALLGLEQSELALSAGVSRQTLITIEANSREQKDPRRKKKLEAIRCALEEKYGVEFLTAEGLKGEGVRLKGRSGS